MPATCAEHLSSRKASTSVRRSAPAISTRTSSGTAIVQWYGSEGAFTDFVRGPLRQDILAIAMLSVIRGSIIPSATAKSLQSCNQAGLPCHLDALGPMSGNSLKICVALAQLNPYTVSGEFTPEIPKSPNLNPLGLCDASPGLTSFGIKIGTST